MMDWVETDNGAVVVRAGVAQSLAVVADAPPAVTADFSGPTSTAGIRSAFEMRGICRSGIGRWEEH